MSIELVQVNLAWCIVDKSVPGWRTIETHGEKDRAERRLKAHLTGAKSANHGAGGVVVPSSEGGEDHPDAPLHAFLDGSVRDVRARIVACEDIPTLERLSAIEDEQAGRKTVIKALASRISALS